MDDRGRVAQLRRYTSWSGVSVLLVQRLVSFLYSYEYSVVRGFCSAQAVIFPSSRRQQGAGDGERVGHWDDVL
jgi:hypothetical protein